MCESFFYPEMVLLFTDIFSQDHKFLSYLALTSKAIMNYIFSKCQYVIIDNNDVPCISLTKFDDDELGQNKMYGLARYKKLVCYSDNHCKKKYLVTDSIMRKTQFDIFNVSFVNCKNILIIYNLSKYKDISKDDLTKRLKHKLDCLAKIKYDKIEIILKNDINAEYLPKNCDSLIVSTNHDVKIICNSYSFTSLHITKFENKDCRFYNPNLFRLNKKITMFGDKITSFTGYIDNLDILNMCNLEVLCVKQSDPFQKTLVDFSKFSKLIYLSITSCCIIPQNIPPSVSTLDITVDPDSNYDFSELVNLEDILIMTTCEFYPRFKIPDNHKVWQSCKYFPLNQ